MNYPSLKVFILCPKSYSLSKIFIPSNIFMSLLSGIGNSNTIIKQILEQRSKIIEKSCIVRITVKFSRILKQKLQH